MFVGSGMKPMRFEIQMKRNRVAMNGNHFAAMLASMLLRVMLSRMRLKTVSTAVCTRLGRSCMRCAM